MAPEIKQAPKKMSVADYKKESKRSELEIEFLYYLKIAKLPMPEEEYLFAKPRKWRFDFAYPDKKIAIEMEGGVWSGGRHRRPIGFIKDMEKYNAASMAGWRVLRYYCDNVSQSVEDLKTLL